MEGSAGVLLRRGTWHAVPYDLSDVATCPVLVDDAIIDQDDLHEDLNLGFDLAALVRVIAWPLFVEGIDAAPCTVVGELSGD